MQPLPAPASSTAPESTSPGSTETPRNVLAETVSIVGCFVLMWWVRMVTGRGAFEIIMDALPPIPGIG